LRLALAARESWRREKEINPVVRGWINYYGRYFPSRLVASLVRIGGKQVQ